MSLRLIETMSTQEIQEYLAEKKRQEYRKPVKFYVDKVTMQKHFAIRKELAKKIPVPPKGDKPSKYIFHAESEVKEDLELHFENGQPHSVMYGGENIGTFSMNSANDDDAEFTTESGTCEEFWALLEKHPNLFVKVATKNTSIGESHTFKIYATVQIGDMSWFY